MITPGLRSPYEKVGGLVYFGRMLDKIRLHSKGALPEEYHANLGKGFDERCVNFLRIPYDRIVVEIKKGLTDEQLLDWAFQNGHRPTDGEIEIWNEFMIKRGWKDSGTLMLQKRLKEGGFENRVDIQTFFDYIDLDEGRDPLAKS